ncbi:MAG: hypothetical protein JXN10_00785, partial [Clostridia bacterium]|nr:hypothetical protein [Clostridia bacterium]
EAMESGVWAYIMSEDLTVIDQYGRVMEDPWFDNWDWDLEGVTDETHVFYDWDGDYYVDTTSSAGVDTFVAFLTDDGDAQDESGFQFDVRNVAATEIDGLAIADIAGPMYLGPEYDKWDAEADDYWKTFSITGTVDGLVVVLLDDDADGVPDIVDLVTSTNDNVQVSGAWLIPAEPLTGNAAGTTTIKVWRNGVVQDMTDLALSTTAPDLASIELTDEDDINWMTPITFMHTAFEYYDQYGVIMNPAFFDEGFILCEYPDSFGDMEIVDESEIWWFTVVKYDGTIWKIIYVDVEDIFPG